MRSLLRSLLILLIAFAVPVAGWANAVGYGAQRCPMTAGGLAGMQTVKGKADCCADMATVSKTGNPCKAGQECKIGSLGQPAAVIAFMPVQAASPLSGFQSHPLLAAVPGGVWRPPRQV